MRPSAMTKPCDAVVNPTSLALVAAVVTTCHDMPPSVVRHTPLPPPITTMSATGDAIGPKSGADRRTNDAPPSCETNTAGVIDPPPQTCSSQMATTSVALEAVINAGPSVSVHGAP